MLGLHKVSYGPDPDPRMFLLSIPTHARRQMNSEYAMALRRVAEVVATAPALPRRLEFTSIVPAIAEGDSRGHVLLTWTSGSRTLRLEFDADGPVDYWCEPDCGPLPGG